MGLTVWGQGLTTSCRENIGENPPIRTLHYQPLTNEIVLFSFTPGPCGWLGAEAEAGQSPLGWTQLRNERLL